MTCDPEAGPPRRVPAPVERSAEVLFGLLAAACACSPPATAADGPAAAAPDWEIEAAAFGYFIPGEDNYLQPGLAADRGRLHLEARYNYEDQDTASVWAGAKFSGTLGEAEWGVTPMLGWVFGNTRGVAPGVMGYVAWRWLEFYTEGEIVFDTGRRDDSFAYFWSELSAWPLDWLRTGFVAQRTRAYDTELDVQRGPLLGVGGERWSVTGYLFNPDQDDAVLVVGATLAF